MTSYYNVQRTTATYSVENIRGFKQQMLSWANRFNICCFLDSHQYKNQYSSFDCLLGVGALSFIEANEQALTKLEAYTNQHNDWLFGHLSYDLKNETEGVASHETDNIGFPFVYFFQPEIVIEVNNNSVIIHSATKQPSLVMEELQAVHELSDAVNNAGYQPIKIQSRITKEQYIKTVNNIRSNILRGDCYELNFCQEFFAEGAVINPLSVYQSLTKISPNPFAGYYKLSDKFLLCASPERYLKKKGDKIISQPIKGTLGRNNANPLLDTALKNALYNSAKDRSENVMVVDLVRNDLSKICEEGTVTVNELFGIYSFPQVHQMISTVEGTLRPGTSFADIVKASFPMGSMTGAPRHNVVQLIDRHEQSRRGIFSGALGYITPAKDFDFNVVIRSIMYNATRRFLSYQVGGGITFYSDAEKEYEECLLKASAIEQVFNAIIN